MTTLVLEAEPAAENVQIDGSNIRVYLADGRGLSVPLEWYPRLLHATPDERNNW